MNKLYKTFTCSGSFWTEYNWKEWRRGRAVTNEIHTFFFLGMAYSTKLEQTLRPHASSHASSAASATPARTSKLKKSEKR
jgi:hypothetical protein